jgi:predicted metal-dependent phosphoesterase TrpH
VRFDLHVHTSCSDGRDTVKAILEAAVRRSLDGIAITDHDTLRGWAAARELIRDRGLSMILIPGVEVSTAEGHLLVLGIEELPKRKRSLEETMEEAHNQGGIAVVPHPYHPFRHSLGRIPPCDAVEVYNSRHLFGMANARARWEAGRRGIPMVAGSDSHYARTVGLGVTRIEGESAEDVLAEILAGRTAIEARRTPPGIVVGNTFKAICQGIRKGLRRR